MSTHAMSEKYANDFSIIHHCTSIRAAINILETKSIYGLDNDKHANFGAVHPNQMLAREIEVSLEFKWPYEQKMCFSTCFVSRKPDNEYGGPKPNILYHIFNEHDYLDGVGNLMQRRYWQSNIYPGSSGLIFKGVSDIQYSEAKHQCLLKRLFSRRAREEHSTYIWVKKIRTESTNLSE